MKGGEAGAPRAVGRARAGVRMPGGGPRANTRSLARSAGLLPTHPLSPFVSLPRPCPRRGPACPSQSPRRPPPPLPFRRVCCLARPGTTRRASGVPGAAPGRPAVLPGGLLTGTEACSFSSRTSPSSETQVANLAGFGAGKPECGACASPCGVSVGPRVLGHLCWSPPLVTTGTCLWIQTPAAWLRGTQSYVLPYKLW